MYDEFSLERALSNAGFTDVRSTSPVESRIPAWADYHLDSDADGRPYKPDSLYMEARAPAPPQGDR
jgi:hypothetical protein